MDLQAMTAQACAGHSVSRDDALAILRSSDDELLAVVAAAGAVRRRFFGRRMKLNYLVNLKSGLCPEDCHYCSQALGADAGVLKYSWLSPEAAQDAVAAGVQGGAQRVCLVASGRGPSNRDVDRVGGIIEQIKTEHPSVEVCACLGFVTEEQAARLHAAGADAYNHNLNSAESNYAEICTTHSFADRAETVGVAQAGGLSPCSGIIAGMGESDDQLVEVLFALRELGVDSVPVNFLLPFEGTPLAGHDELTPQRCLRILAAARFVCPDTELRAAAGREFHIRTLQPLAFEIVNSIFLGDYLTSEGQGAVTDLEMLADGGFTVVGPDGVDVDPRELLRRHADAHAAVAEEQAACEHSCGGCAESEPAVAIRRRGAGTAVAPNA